MRKRIPNLILIIFLGIFFGAIFTNSNSNNFEKTLPQNSEQKFDKEFSGKVFVIDGDSIKVGDKEVRLLEIDAPEYRQTCFDNNNDEYNCGKISRSFLVKLANKKEAKCFYDQKDIYDRYLAKCYIGEISINEEILKNGMAVIYDLSH
jgi:endonuclease YncB( thermonuclease family)